MPGVKTSLNSSLSACRTCMRKCWQWFHCHRPVLQVLVVEEQQDQYSILCLGLSRTGKSTLLHHLVGDSAPEPEHPTTGFNLKSIPLSHLYPEAGLATGKSVSVREIGGSKAVRAFWSNFYSNINAILFVVNCAATQEDLLQSKDVLSEVLSERRSIGADAECPCLILGTHSDVEGGRDSSQLQQVFADAMTHHKWAVRICCAFDEEQVRSALQVLIHLMVHKSAIGSPLST